MFENDANSSPSQNDEHSNSSTSTAARFPGVRFGRRGPRHASVPGGVRASAAWRRLRVDEAALEGLKQAWQLACKLKERSIAEYAFERLEPYLSSDEAAACAEQLQSLALDKLEEYGLSREDLEDMTDMISQDFLGFDAARLMRVEHVTEPSSACVAEAAPQALRALRRTRAARGRKGPSVSEVQKSLAEAIQLAATTRTLMRWCRPSRT